MSSLIETKRPTRKSITRKKPCNYNDIKIPEPNKRAPSLKKPLLTCATALILLCFLMPLGYGVITSLKSEKWLSSPDAPVRPASPLLYKYKSKKFSVYSLNNNRVIILKKGREESTLYNIESKDSFQWKGKWRTLKPIWKTTLHWSNFKEAWSTMEFPRLLLNTLFYTLLSTFGMLLSSSFVAFGFARFKFPGVNIAFIIVISTMILPPSVTLIPTYAFFHKIGLVGTWAPLIIPCFFANAYNVFLLRQFFMGIPRSLDEAAMMDGANYFTIFFKIIIPQAIPALVAVGLFHFFYCWNDFFGPLLYLAGQPDKFPISLGLSNFVNMYKEKTTLIQSASLISTVIPFIIFIIFQSFFMQGIVVTGEDK